MKKLGMTKRKKGAWFYSVRGSYLPCSWQGWLVEVCLVILFFFGTKVVLFGEESVQASSFFTLFTFLVALGVSATWIAQRKS